MMIIEGLFNLFRKFNSKRIEKLKERIYSCLGLSTVIIGGLAIRIMVSFVGWIRALLISWGVLDGYVSYKMYKEEKTFPYQFIRFGRIIANLSGIISPIIPFVWNVSDGIYSLVLYHRAHPTEQLSRISRIANGIMYIAFS
ncbi:MAG: hypothetical protein QXX30_01145 [Candidatus Aenigmatarchaeota archaeon]